MCFRPLCGVSLFLRLFSYPMGRSFMGFRPLCGVSLFLRKELQYCIKNNIVFVPSAGYLYFYSITRKQLKEIKGFRPLCGVSLFLRWDGEEKIIQMKFSSPLRGISISTQVLIAYTRVATFSSPLRGISISTK